MALNALALNCTLKTGTDKSSTDRLLGEVLAAMKEFDVQGEILRVANFTANPEEDFGSRHPDIGNTDLDGAAFEHRQARC